MTKSEKDMQENREMVLQFLRDDAPSDAQIIDMLLLLLDDWQIREAIMRCVQRRAAAPSAGVTTTTTSTDKNN